MKRLRAVVEQFDGTIEPDIEQWCFLCVKPIWWRDWKSELCIFCEDKVTADDIRRELYEQDWRVTLYDYQIPHGITHEAKSYPTETRREM
ncbi:hypothetical protein [Brevibacterium casei]|uniref:hypothetical protein n=1 Tax=Brevibacterium casei TaxID=33889 RepID=UPI0036F86890